MKPLTIDHIQLKKLNPFRQPDNGKVIADGSNILGVLEYASRGTNRLLKYSEGSEILRNDNWAGFMRDLHELAEGLK